MLGSILLVGALARARRRLAEPEWKDSVSSIESVLNGISSGILNRPTPRRHKNFQTSKSTVVCCRCCRTAPVGLLGARAWTMRRVVVCGLGFLYSLVSSPYCVDLAFLFENLPYKFVPLAMLRAPRTSVDAAAHRLARA